MKKILKNLSQVQIIALGYAILILFGACLLSLPVSRQPGVSPGFLDSLFTATSSSCVTGLITVDTATTWSFFGQAVILFLIQIGGLGFMTIATVFFSLFRRKLGLREKAVMTESINASPIGGIAKLAKKILFGTLCIEGAAAVILFFRFYFHYDFSAGKAIWFAVFHAVSAFCNAGFDLNGSFASFTAFSGDCTVNLVLMSLILIGGLGFLVWEDLFSNRFRLRRCSLHTKIVLLFSAILVFLPALFFFISEYRFANSDLSVSEKVLASFFEAVTPRTAGFNTTDVAALSPAGKIMTMFLMLVGGCPGSTAGGIKTTTLAILFFFCIGTLRRRKGVFVFGRRLYADDCIKAVLVFFLNLSIAIAGGVLILLLQPGIGLDNSLFEAFSAIGTVGMTTGITRDLGLVSRILIILMMYVGRIGSISFGTAIMERKGEPAIQYPHEHITIG